VGKGEPGQVTMGFDSAFMASCVLAKAKDFMDSNHLLAVAAVAVGAGAEPWE
jgi:hypothetical protein